MSIKPRRIRAASGGKIDAFIDTFGGGYVDLALELGVAPDRIDTIIDFAAAAKHGVKMEGNSAAAMPRCLQNSTPAGVDEPRDCEAYGPNLPKGSYLSPTRIYQSCCKPPTHPAGIWLAPVARTLIADRLKAKNPEARSRPGFLSSGSCQAAKTCGGSSGDGDPQVQR